MIDLSTDYLGLKLRTPLVPSASPLTHELDSVRRLEDCGASAMVLYTLFEESPRPGPAILAAEHSRALDSYLAHLRRVKESVTVPVIASLSAVTMDGWVNYARRIEQAGANAVELNLYQVPSQLDISGAQIEEGYVNVVKSVKSSVGIPVAAKLTPYFSSMANMAHRFDVAGADGLVLFNRFYQPDINLENLQIEPSVLLSKPQALRLPLTWIGILWGRIKASMAGTSGVHEAEDVVKLLLVGADVTMLCSSLLRNGISHLSDLEIGLHQWLDKHEYASVAQLKGGLSQIRCPDPSAFERAQYLNAVRDVQNVVVTGREAWKIITGS